MAKRGHDRDLGRDLRRGLATLDGGSGMGDFCPTIRLSALRPLLAAAIFAIFAMAGLAGAAAAQGTVRSVHSDWQVRCDTPAGAQGEQCALIQSVTAEDRANVGLTVIILKTADQKSRLLRVVAPMGVLLPSGLGLKIDNADVGRAGFVRCLPNGCVAEVVMDDESGQADCAPARPRPSSSSRRPRKASASR